MSQWCCLSFSVSIYQPNAFHKQDMTSYIHHHFSRQGWVTSQSMTLALLGIHLPLAYIALRILRNSVIWLVILCMICTHPLPSCLSSRYQWRTGTSQDCPKIHSKRIKRAALLLSQFTLLLKLGNQNLPRQQQRGPAYQVSSFQRLMVKLPLISRQSMYLSLLALGVQALSCCC